jgi:uncharacterized protein (TIGR00266 family)
MRIEIAGAPAYALAYTHLGHGEAFFAERGAMAAMSEGISVKGRVNGGIRKAMLRKVTEESFFMGEYRAEVHGAWVAFAPKYPGDIAELAIAPDHPMIVQSGSLLGHAETVENGVRVNGMAAMIMKEGIAATRLRGHGPALICSYGALQSFNLPIGSSVTVDTGHLVAWSEKIDMRVGMVGGAVTSMTTGEGLAARLTGTSGDCRVYIQTRSEPATRDWLFPERAQNEGLFGRFRP